MNQSPGKSTKVLFVTAVLLICLSQIVYLPGRLRYGQHLVTYARLTNTTNKQRLAYAPADYDLLAWLEVQTPTDSRLLLVTNTSPVAGDALYVLYHRALVHLYPRPVGWLAPPSATHHYPTWWHETDLSESTLRQQAAVYGADVLLFEGFTEPPLPGETHYFDDDTFLLFLGGS